MPVELIDGLRVEFIDGLSVKFIDGLWANTGTTFTATIGDDRHDRR